MNWMSHTDIGPWFAGKNVNVVMPIGGAYPLYTDWNTADPILGVNKWNSYMTHELPPLIDAEFHGNGRDAIAGLSSTGAAALDIAGHAPQRFRAAASYSGCPVRSGALGWPVSSIMMAAGSGSSVNAWGLPGSPAWADHDPNAQPHRLRDVKVFVASASGTPAPSTATTAPPNTWARPQPRRLPTSAPTSTPAPPAQPASTSTVTTPTPDPTPSRCSPTNSRSAGHKPSNRPSAAKPTAPAG